MARVLTYIDRTEGWSLGPTGLGSPRPSQLVPGTKRSRPCGQPHRPVSILPMGPGTCCCGARAAACSQGTDVKSPLSEGMSSERNLWEGTCALNHAEWRQVQKSWEQLHRQKGTNRSSVVHSSYGCGSPVHGNKPDLFLLSWVPLL